MVELIWLYEYNDMIIILWLVCLMKYERFRIFIKITKQIWLLAFWLRSLENFDCIYSDYGKQAHLRFWLWTSDYLIIIRNSISFLTLF